MNSIQNDSWSQYNNVGGINAFSNQVLYTVFVAFIDILVLFIETVSKQKYLCLSIGSFTGFLTIFKFF